MSTRVTTPVVWTDSRGRHYVTVPSMWDERLAWETLATTLDIRAEEEDAFSVEFVEADTTGATFREAWRWR